MPNNQHINEVDQLIEKAGNLIDEKNYQSAIESLKTVASNFEERIEVSPFLKMGLHSYFGLANYHLDNLKLAVEHFDVALEIKEASENILFMRAKCHDYLNNFEQAKSDYERVIELNPNADCVHAFLGLLMENEGYEDRAVKLYQEALKQDPTYDAIRERLESILGKTKKGSELL